MRANIASRLREFPRAKPEETPEGQRLYLTVYPEVTHNMDSIKCLTNIMIILSVTEDG